MNYIFNDAVPLPLCYDVEMMKNRVVLIIGSGRGSDNIDQGIPYPEGEISYFSL